MLCYIHYMASFTFCACMHACVRMWDSRLCHIPPVRGCVRLRLANVAAPLLWRLHKSSTQRGFCRGIRDNAGIGQGGHCVLRRQYSHSDAQATFLHKKVPNTTRQTVQAARRWLILSVCADYLPFVMLGTPSLVPPGKCKRPDLWMLAVHLRHGRCHRSIPCLEACGLWGTPSGCLWRHTPLSHTEGLQQRQTVHYHKD